MYSTYDSANKLAELQNNCSILGVNIQNLCDYVIIDKIQDGVRFGQKSLNMRYPHTRIIIHVGDTQRLFTLIVILGYSPYFMQAYNLLFLEILFFYQWFKRGKHLQTNLFFFIQAWKKS